MPDDVDHWLTDLGPATRSEPFARLAGKVADRRADDAHIATEKSATEKIRTDRQGVPPDSRTPPTDVERLSNPYAN
jgi:hypothetical protein